MGIFLFFFALTKSSIPCEQRSLISPRRTRRLVLRGDMRDLFSQGKSSSLISSKDKWFTPIYKQRAVPAMDSLSQSTYHITSYSFSWWNCRTASMCLRLNFTKCPWCVFPREECRAADKSSRVSVWTTGNVSAIFNVWTLDVFILKKICRIGDF